MSWFKASKHSGPDWETLTDQSQIDFYLKKSHEVPVVIFKHSTRCAISSMAKNRLESNWDLSKEQIIPVYLDLLTYRSISNQLATDFDVQHESPQLILLKNGVSIYNASHSNISVDALKQQL